MTQHPGGLAPELDYVVLLFAGLDVDLLELRREMRILVDDLDIWHETEPAGAESPRFPAPPG